MKRISSLVEKKRLVPVEWSELVGLLERGGHIAYAQGRADAFATRARRALAPESDSPIKTALADAVLYAVARAN